MRVLNIVICVCTLLWAGAVRAASLSDDLMARIVMADVVILGEVHDNPAHHHNQSDLVDAMNPKAVVWEMLTSAKADRFNLMTPQNPLQMARILKWTESGWPPFDMYYPIFAAAPGAKMYGGEVPRAAVMTVLQDGLIAAFGAGAKQYGLSIELPTIQQAQRETLQNMAHCQAIPADKLAAMVDIQRLRDAVLAREAIAAIADTGGPVAVITGNGHARRDWGISAYLKHVRPDLSVFVLGQSENGQIDGVFDAVLDSPPIDRGDPCAGLRNSN